ncbi:MAG TPA: monovalent cation/H+ antiporter complex subunit F [Lentimicrobium sp.]|jgi:multicomponent Na+:H+ antiporter subunit F|nr:monovalent cation/H+ antiporter complex subunit F [Lentimicrobium sp.]HPR25304.1 monovalent cation/H+ antiporter complex subunit F [Lentimicrobium sp.]
MNAMAIQLPDWVTLTSLVVLALSMLLALIGLFRGPSLPDRIVALDLIASLSIGFTIVFAVSTGNSRYLDIAAIVALVIFIGTVAYASYLKKKYYD